MSIIPGFGQDFEPKAATVALEQLFGIIPRNGNQREERKHEPSECDRDYIRRRGFYSGDPLL